MPSLTEMEWFIRLAERMLTTKNERGREVNVVDALFAVADGMQAIADAIQDVNTTLRKQERD